MWCDGRFRWFGSQRIKPPKPPKFTKHPRNAPRGTKSPLGRIKIKIAAGFPFFGLFAHIHHKIKPSKGTNRPQGHQKRNPSHMPPVGFFPFNPAGGGRFSTTKKIPRTPSFKYRARFPPQTIPAQQLTSVPTAGPRKRPNNTQHQGAKQHPATAPPKTLSGIAYNTRKSAKRATTAIARHLVEGKDTIMLSHIDFYRATVP